MTEIFEVTREYRANRKMSLRTFADHINERLVNTNVSHVLVSRWENEKNYYEPDMRLLFECLATYNDWRALWAVDCLKSMFPDLFISGVVRIKLPRAE